MTSEGVDPGDTLDLLNERNMERYKLQRRLVGPVYSINGIKRHENHLNSTLSAFMDRMKGLKGEPFELVKWTNIWAIGETAYVIRVRLFPETYTRSAVIRYFDRDHLRPPKWIH